MDDLVAMLEAECTHRHLQGDAAGVNSDRVPSANVFSKGKFVNYPYGDPLGVVIGDYMGLYMNANTNFWATDGIAAAGHKRAR